MTLMFDISSIIVVLYLVFFRHKYCVQNVSTYLWSSFFIFVFVSDKKYVLNVRHVNCDHCSLGLCLPELNTVPIMFNISILNFFCVCICPSLLMSPYFLTHYLWTSFLMLVSAKRYIMCSCSTHHLWSSFIMFVSSRVKYHILDVWHVIRDHSLS